jgi:hypothetical protein
MAITNTQITSTNTTVYSSSGNNAITTMIICNTSPFNPTNPISNQSLVSIYAVPSGSTATTGTMIINALPIPAGETVTLDQEKIVLSNGDSIIAKTDSLNNITVTVSYLVV